MRARSDGKPQGNEKQLSYSADIIIQLRADGTYRIIKDRPDCNFEPRDERVFGIRDAGALNLPKMAVMAGRMDGGVFRGRRM